MRQCIVVVSTPNIILIPDLCAAWRGQTSLRIKIKRTASTVEFDWKRLQHLPHTRNTHTCMHAYKHTHKHAHTHTHTYTHTHTHTDVCIHTHTHAQTRTYTHTYAYVCRHANTHTHKRTHARTHTHYMPCCVLVKESSTLFSIILVTL